MATNVDLNASGHLFQQTESGSIDYKISVRALVSRAGLPAYTRVGSVITANANGALAAQDGVTLVAGERVLIADDNVAHADHGPYDLTSVGSAGTPFVFTRASDADASAEVTAGLLVHVAEGTSHLDSGWLLVTDDPITLNTTALNFRKGYQMGQVMTLNTAQTVSGDKTYTGALVLPQGAAPAQTAEGSIVWDTDDDVLTVGTGAGRKTMADLDSTQTLTNKTLTAPVIASRTSGAAGQTSTANVADGGSAVAHSFDNTTALTTTAKLASFKNAGVEKAAIEQGGAIIAPSIGTATTTQHALPTGTGALVSTDATQTLTGKTLTDPTINAGGGTLVLPAANAPSQTAEGSIVWDDDSDLLTVGTGAGRKTMVDTDSTQTLSGKTLTNPTINAGSGTIVLPASAAPAQTAEGSVVWDSDDDLLTVGDGAGRKVMVDTSSAQTLAGPKTLTNPVINAGSGTIVLPASAAPA
ncbi:MAG TPA: hypothetical protein VEJ18_02090, partial [Planctomycetota bacterium]|nr:hypothetical protein [Planctomycetota bacterium]